MHSLGSQYVSVAKDGKVYHLFDASRMVIITTLINYVALR